ncbi:zinc ribbon domain-containing protein [Campylobacter geochelonis]|uniref:Chromosome segregation protein SMC n=1 Tax=Campylobacter geochelonis TaxID=1780362 RepID=A0A128EJF6_9BACT|nr:zinc ribbon domain-containing protein [Campylobacter geochelonis]QKF70926.1 zinc ribbon domain-containing protein (DUF164 domain) [Campylobacter geochelonis]CZE46975.1 chromosome segregation protein SMC [Campylobacter geochelonis]CZE49075.1 chromosome segregation protein SMC [Campylobacter geochelonis]CZE51227.1 chromosome segregation protein SMC [Campylobacter geochelonis]
MNKYLEQLVELSEYDKNIDSFIPKIESIEKNLNAKKEEIEATNKDIEKVLEEIADLKSQISNTNAHIAEFSSKIKDTGKKSSSVKTEREVKALNLEENLAKEQLNAANEDIARLEKVASVKEDIKKELNTKLEEFKNALEEINKSTQKERDEIEVQRNEICEKKNALLKEMDQKILTFYEKIRKWAGNTAVVPVRKQACYGCFMSINDKTYLSVIRSDDIITCPHCGRILYKETEAE